MFALDTNILVYAHNIGSAFHAKASAFVKKIVAERDENGQHVIGVSAQVCAEFINVITRQTLEKPLSLAEAVAVIEKYIKAGVPIIHAQTTQLFTFLELAKSATTRKKTFDFFLAATLKDNGIEGLYTVNTSDFQDFTFLKVVNPLV
ncbi:PIN domain-containing protein [candidate division KSB1 bacterium]|nr:PIN domain-containing protein [candidate division KSB1 bacterium]